MGLFKPGWMSKNEDRALRALDKVSDDRTLVEITEKAPLAEVRSQAVWRIGDPHILEDLARSSSYLDVGEAAIFRLRIKPLILADIAKNNRDVERMKAAVERLEKPALIADVAKHSKSQAVRKQAIIKLIGASTSWSHQWDGGFGRDKTPAEYEEDLVRDVREKLADRALLDNIVDENGQPIIDEETRTQFLAEFNDKPKANPKKAGSLEPSKPEEKTVQATCNHVWKSEWGGFQVECTICGYIDEEEERRMIEWSYL